MNSEAIYVIDRARNGDLEFFQNTPLDVLMNVRDNEDDCILSMLVKGYFLECCEVICRRCPSLIYHQTRAYKTAAIHHAAYRGDVEIMKLIISVCLKADWEYQQGIESQGGDKAHPLKTFTMRDIYGENAMHKCTHQKKIEAVKLLIEADPDKELLRAGNNDNDTPLHLAVGLRYNLEIAKLLIEADPDFPYNANKNGETPLLIAINQAVLNSSPDMLKLILEKQPSQAKVPVGNNGWTALHYAVSKGFITSVGDIIQCCPESSEVVDNEGRNFLHLACRLEDANMVKHILGMNVISSSVLNGQDNLGKTPLDDAAISENESIVLCLVQDHRVEKRLTVTKHLHWVVQKNNFAMMNLLMEAIPDLFKGIESEILLNSRDNNGDTILFKAAQENHLFLCKEIYERCPSLIYHKGEGGRTALHHAAVRGEPEMLKFLIDAGAKSYNEDDEEDIESGGGEKLHPKMLLTMVDEQGDTALHKAVLSHKLEAVRLLVDADPDFEYSSNISGDTPLMIAIREAQLNENKYDTGKIRKLLFMMQPNQIKVCTGENEWTLLHHAAYNGDVSIVADIIKFCPSCLELVDNEGKNFLHIAAKWEKVQVVKHVLGARDIPVSVLNDQDNDGNTPLHIAAITGNETLTQCFLFDPRVVKTTVNKNGQPVLHAIKFSYDKRKAGVFDIVDTVDQSDLKDQRDFDLVVGALIATVSFTAGITVPGGYISDGPNQGMAVFSKKGSFVAFIISNNMALIFSLYAVFSHFCARRLSEEADIIYQLNVATFCTLAAIYCMMVAFIMGSFAVLANSNWLGIVVSILSCFFFIFACRPIWRIAMQRKRSTVAGRHMRST
ncbi:Ankyrin repeat-containing protein [Thalictrum thalictroides]|uniref:Ankyrin repeat-containing protein n=1 Tax=Thalictrum thalictroides TaxID=46969 RepID=A0A7J6WIS3_THATH|nr:Ankyrin repeat-containing protein [Thalictrum thalictroides]